MQPPPPLVFAPGKAGVTSPGGQNRPLLGRAIKAKVRDGTQAATTVNPFTKRAAEGMERGTILYSSYILKVKYAQDRPRYIAARIDRY